MHSKDVKEPVEEKGYTGKDVLYREGAVGLFDVQRAADALLRLGIKPSVAAIRNQIGGGSPNTITPLLAKYWEKLGSRLGDGPESLERVPEALARVTELLWRRALEEARERLKILQQPDTKPGVVEELQDKIGELSVALAEARAREGEQLMHLATLSNERKALHVERGHLLSLLKSTQGLLEEKSDRVRRLEGVRSIPKSRGSGLKRRRPPLPRKRKRASGGATHSKRKLARRNRGETNR
jgi:chromosome segregation ATPase